MLYHIILTVVTCSTKSLKILAQALGAAWPLTSVTAMLSKLTVCDYVCLFVYACVCAVCASAPPATKRMEKMRYRVALAAVLHTKAGGVRTLAAAVEIYTSQ